jgi:hypothetical protein
MGQLEGICKDCMFLSGSTYLTYENGSHADVAMGVYNHHVAIFDMGKTTKTPFSCTYGGGSMNGGTFGLGAQSQGKSGAGGMGKGSKGSMGGSGGMAGMGHGAIKSRSVKRQVGAMPGMTQLFGSGDDGMARIYHSKDPSLKTGFYIGKSDNLYHTSEFVNYKSYPQTIYITAEVEWVPGKPAGYVDAMMGAMSATGCGGVGYCMSTFTVPNHRKITYAS